MKYNFEIEAIVATDMNNGFSKNNTIPWYIPMDMKHFREITTYTPHRYLQNVVIMGRKTYEQMGKLLPNRINIILTKNRNLQINNDSNIKAYLCSSYEEALYICETLDNIHKVFIIGGRGVYDKIIDYNHVNTIHKTVIFDNFNCDTFFPDISNKYKKIFTSEMLNQNNYQFNFETWKLQSPMPLI